MQKECPEHNYAELDQSVRTTYYADRLQIARDLGYDHLSEGIIKTYRQLRSMPKTAKVFDYYYPGTISYLLRKYGEPSFGPGGPNRKARIFK